MTDDYNHLLGKRCWTPFEPRGVFVVTMIEQPCKIYGVTAFGYFERHNKYPAGSVGRYPARELTLIKELSDVA